MTRKASQDTTPCKLAENSERIGRNWLVLLIVFVLLPAVAPAAECQIDQMDAAGTGLPGTGSLLLADAGTGTRRNATVLSMEVDFDVSGVIARASVRQWFRNDGAEWTEALYVFPLPDGAAVDTMRLEVDGRIIVGEIREKAVARSIYNQARDAGQRAGLVEVAHRNLFTTAVANIPPYAEVLVEIGYQETLAWSGREYSLRFPLTFTPRYCTNRDAAGSFTRASMSNDMPVDGQMSNVRVTAHIEPGFPVDGLQSAYHDIAVIPAVTGYAVTLIGDTVPADRDFELRWAPAGESEPAAAVFSERIDDEDYVLLMLMPPHPDGIGSPTGTRTARDIVFVLDTSGSMAGPALQQAQAALDIALSRLSGDDRFNIIEFNTVPRMLYPELRHAGTRQIALAQRVVMGLEVGGGTEMYAALDLAFGEAAEPGRLRQIVFITDGAVGDEKMLLDLIRERLGEARLFPVGIGPAPNSAFLRQAAEEGRGSATWIGGVEEVRERISVLFERLERPALTDIEVGWPGGAAESWPAKIPDLYAGQPMVMAARTRFNGGIITVTGRMNGQHWVRQLAMPAAAHHPGVARQWARRKIQGLEDLVRSGFPAEEIRSRATDVALRFGLVSSYTSLVAVDRTPVRTQFENLRRARVANSPPVGHGVRLPATDAGSYRALVIGLLALLMAALLWPWPGSRMGAVRWRR